jgi:hypothetical protein
MRYTSMRCRPSEVHIHEVHTHEVRTHEIHTHQVHTHGFLLPFNPRVYKGLIQNPYYPAGSPIWPNLELCTESSFWNLTPSPPLSSFLIFSVQQRPRHATLFVDNRLAVPNRVVMGTGVRITELGE